MIYDLTHTINDSLPVYPGDPTVRIEQCGTIVSDGYADRQVTLGTHNGTHIDAPAHMIEGGKELKEYPIERFVTRAVCIDVRDGFEGVNVDAVIPNVGMAAIFYTGASEYLREETYWHDYPVLPIRLVQELIQKQVNLVGIDTGSFDSEDGFPVHKALLGADILLVENLTNLRELAGKEFEFSALPLKLEADGAPVRAVART